MKTEISFCPWCEEEHEVEIREEVTEEDGFKYLTYYCPVFMEEFEVYPPISDEE